MKQWQSTLMAAVAVGVCVVIAGLPYVLPEQPRSHQQKSVSPEAARWLAEIHLEYLRERKYLDDEKRRLKEQFNRARQGLPVDDIRVVDPAEYERLITELKKLDPALVALRETRDEEEIDRIRTELEKLRQQWRELDKTVPLLPIRPSPTSNDQVSPTSTPR